MKIVWVVLAALLPAVAYSVGEAGDADWPKDARIEVDLRLSASVETNGQMKVSGDLFIKNPNAVPLTIQSPHNRLALAFLVFDPLGNPVAPKGLAKVDPAFLTHSLSGHSTYAHHFESLDFITGSALFGYELSSGKSYKILAVYRPAGPHGPGFASQETNVEIPNLARLGGDSQSPASASDAVVADDFSKYFGGRWVDTHQPNTCLTITPTNLMISMDGIRESWTFVSATNSMGALFVTRNGAIDRVSILEASGSDPVICVGDRRWVVRREPRGAANRSQPVRSETVTTHTGDYSVNGWKIAVSVTPDVPSVILGEPTWLSFKVENFSDENLQLIVGGDYRNEYGRPNSFKIRVTDQEGRAVPQPQVKWEAGGLIAPRPLLAKSNYTFRLFVPDWATFDKPGRYTFECARTLQLTKAPKDASFWTNASTVQVSAKAGLTVTPPDFVRMFDVIEKLAAELLAGKEPSWAEARKALASIHDDRVLPIWLKSLEQKTYDAKFHALTALGDYPAAESVAALKRAVDLKGADFPGCCTTGKVAESLAKNLRVAAVHALAKNTNPEARQFLIARRHTGDDELRLIVVHMLGREKTDESSRLLGEMTADPAQLVSGEAMRYLKERGFTKPTQ